jgi:hypothetical protein
MRYSLAGMAGVVLLAFLSGCDRKTTSSSETVTAEGQR